MIPFKLLLILVAGTAMGAVQVRWAFSNYPSTAGWRVVRIMSSLLGGMVIGLVIAGDSFTDKNGWWIPLFGAIMFCFGLTFLFPANLKRVIPPKDDSSGNG